jgi:ribonuclease BN (tRNA processing enzyme)
MQVQVLGSYGSRAPGFYTSCLLVNGTLLLDAGTVTAALSLEEQAAVDDVLLTHAHLDHMVDLAFLVDNCLLRRSSPLRVWAPAPVLETVHRHIFNNTVWPDFTRLPEPAAPALELIPLEVGREREISGLRVCWRKVNHPVFTAGYRLSGEGSSILFSGDTGSTDDFWEMGRTCPEIKAVFVETSFPNRLSELADASGHLTPASLRDELKKFDRTDVPVKIFHMKPQFLQEILAELNSLGDDRLQVLEGGEKFLF